VVIAGSAVIACKPCLDADCADLGSSPSTEAVAGLVSMAGPPASSGPPAVGSRPAPWHPHKLPTMLGTLNVKIQAIQPG